MKTKNNFRARSSSAVLCATLTLILTQTIMAGCSKQTENNTSAESTSTNQADHSHTKQLAKHSHEKAHSDSGPGNYQKPGADIRLGTPEAISMAANSNEQFNVNFSTVKTGSLSISAKPKDGVSLANSGAQYTFDLSSEPASLDLDITSTNDGTYHIMFNASIQDASGNSTSRVFGIPVYVGKADANKSQKPTNTSGVVIMKAEETVR